jgi:hypothetical protein
MDPKVIVIFFESISLRVRSGSFRNTLSGHSGNPKEVGHREVLGSLVRLPGRGAQGRRWKRPSGRIDLIGPGGWSTSGSGFPRTSGVLAQQ